MATSIQGDFARDGFCILPEPVIEADLIDRARASMDRVREGSYDTGIRPADSKWNPGDDPNSLGKIEMPQLASRALRELVRSPEIGRLAAEITGGTTVQVWWVQLLYKPPTPEMEEAPTRVGWHQDWNYWKSTWEEGGELLTAWVALSDVEPESGPMLFVRGSHHWGYVDGSDFYGQDRAPSHIARPAGSPWDEVPALMPAGAISLHDKLTLHGSDINHSNLPRRSLAIHLRTERSRPLVRAGEGLCRYIEEESVCPVVYG